MRASDRAYRALREEIVEGDLSPGVVLAEVEQAGRLGVSRTPLREALSRLVSEGLALQAPGRGTVVSDISLDDVEHLFELRIPLEVQTARLAAMRRDPAVFAELARRFDQAAARGPEGFTGDAAADYYALTGRLDDALSHAVANPYLTNALRGLRTHLVRIRRLARDRPARLAESAAEHRQICQAVCDGDPETAEAASLIHLRRSLASIQTVGDPAADRTEPAHAPRREESAPL